MILFRFILAPNAKSATILPHLYEIQLSSICTIISDVLNIFCFNNDLYVISNVPRACRFRRQSGIFSVGSIGSSLSVRRLTRKSQSNSNFSKSNLGQPIIPNVLRALSGARTIRFLNSLQEEIVKFLRDGVATSRLTSPSQWWIVMFWRSADASCTLLFNPLQPTILRNRSDLVASCCKLDIHLQPQMSSSSRGVETDVQKSVDGS